MEKIMGKREKNPSKFCIKIGKIKRVLHKHKHHNPKKSHDFSSPHISHHEFFGSNQIEFRSPKSNTQNGESNTYSYHS